MLSQSAATKQQTELGAKFLGPKKREQSEELDNLRFPEASDKILFPSCFLCQMQDKSGCKERLF